MLSCNNVSACAVSDSISIMVCNKQRLLDV
uniref:Uncharacterized protein n=1 Tax=Arundo donax TaxID=35708 RepID=A0A0A9FID3_ARUDO